MTRAPVPVILNPRAGTASGLGDGLAEEIQRAFATAGLSVEILIVGGPQLTPMVAAHKEAPLVVIGGGDGTLGTALAALHGERGTIGLLPLGTRNHLARDLGLPTDLAGAAKVIAAGATRMIDLATVNGRGFVNNASVGVYPLMVRHRDAVARSGLPKWLATIPAAWATLRRLPHHRIHLETADAIDRGLRTPLLFVGNNRYTLERGRIGQRAALHDGTLSVFVVDAQSRRGLLLLAARILLGRADPERDFGAVGEWRALTVRSHARRIDVAIDGEVHRLATPLLFAVAPGALRICVPARDAAA